MCYVKERILMSAPVCNLTILQKKKAEVAKAGSSKDMTPRAQIISSVLEVLHVICGVQMVALCIDTAGSLMQNYRCVHTARERSEPSCWPT